jgi:predicted AAA+ superfamily ATPase
MINLEELRNYQAFYLKILKTDYKRYLYHKIDFKQKLIGIVGARGVGKTTLMLQYLKESKVQYSKKLYINGDVVVDNIFEIAYEFSKVGGKLLIIDEVHKIKDFEIELKKIYDMLELKVIFSGSSALQIDNSKGDLSRRALLYSMKGLSFREFLELKFDIKLPIFSLEEIINNHVNISYELLEDIKPFEFWSEYLQYGYYPFYFEDQAQYPIRLQQTINTVIEVDIPSIFPIDYEKIINLKKLVKLVCLSKPFKINIKELANKIGTSDYQTLYRYLDYLKKAKILMLMGQKVRGDNIFTKPKKLYLANSNLHYAYCQNQEIGTIREVFFASMFDELRLSYTQIGDFLIDEIYIFEIGGKNKSFQQIKDIKNSYVVADDIEVGTGAKIPLWLFGFLY